MAGIHSTPPACNPLIRYRMNAATSATVSGTFKNLPLDTVEFMTPEGWVVFGAAIIVPFAGVYRFAALAKWSANADGLERLVRVTNGVSTVVVAQAAYGGNQVATAAEVSGYTVCAANDSLIPSARQSSGAALNYVGGADGSACWFVVEYLGVLP